MERAVTPELGGSPGSSEGGGAGWVRVGAARTAAGRRVGAGRRRIGCHQGRTVFGSAIARAAVDTAPKSYRRPLWP
jgi:hypothetical protein